MKLDQLAKNYLLERENKRVVAHSDVSFSVQDGDFIASFSPSGSGNTSMLNINCDFMQTGLLNIWTKATKTVVIITHQINEAIYLADRVLVMGARPSRVRNVFEVPFSQPRSLNLKRGANFVELEGFLWKLIEDEAGSLGMAAGV